MKKRNCPNCAAPYDVDLNKCPYCGTSYYDLSALDLASSEPFYLKIKTEINSILLIFTNGINDIKASVILAKRHIIIYIK